MSSCISPQRKYLTPAQASDYLSVAVPTLKKWRRLGTGPAYYKKGRLVRYPIPNLDSWVEESVSRGGKSA